MYNVDLHFITLSIIAISTAVAEGRIGFNFHFVQANNTIKARMWSTVYLSMLSRSVRQTL